mmetsp:Transcript_17240/g.44752  ORF Transcript_17240/g.44752 Transcript_17240/m.44752 type:complete len:209 (+) Transcript_17240:1487-2113(+)
MLPPSAPQARPMQLVTPRWLSSSSACCPSRSTASTPDAAGSASKTTSAALRNSTSSKGSLRLVGGGSSVMRALRAGMANVRMRSAWLASSSSRSMPSSLRPACSSVLRSPALTLWMMRSHTAWQSVSDDSGSRPTTCGALCLRFRSRTSARFLSRADLMPASRSALRAAACTLASRLPRKSEAFLDLCLSLAEAPALRPDLCFLLCCP